MASRGVLVPPSYLPYIFNTAAIIGAVPIVAGAACLLQPSTGMNLLQFPANQDTVGNQKVSYGLLRMYAIRQFAMGLSTLTMWYTGSSRALGLSLLTGSLVAITDGLVSKDVTGRLVVGHLVAVPVSILLGSALAELI